MPLLDIRNLTIEFKTGDEWVKAVDRVSMTLTEGEIRGLVGESGSGKSSGIVQNWLMNMAGYDLYKQAPALVDNVLRMFMPDENITKLIHKTNELSVI